MCYFGCLPLIALTIIVLALSLFGKSIEMLGATAVWLWESFLNLFRTMKKEVRNPWTASATSNAKTRCAARKKKSKSTHWSATKMVRARSSMMTMMASTSTIRK